MANDVNCDQLHSYNNKVLYMQVNRIKLRWLRAICMYGFTIKIETLILAKVAIINSLLKGVSFYKYLFSIYSPKPKHSTVC